MFAYKIVIIGDFGVGKTSLIKRFVDNSFSEDYLSSIGVTISKKQLISKNGTESTMMIWDTEGQTEHKAIFKQYLNGAKAFIIVADLSRGETIKSIKQHIELCQEVVSSAPICIALNKSDIESCEYSIEALKNIAPNILSVYKTSAKLGDAINEIFIDINQVVVQK